MTALNDARTDQDDPVVAGPPTCDQQARHRPHGTCTGIPAVRGRLEQGALKVWRQEGVTLLAELEAGPRMKGSLVELDDLDEFVQYVREHLPGAMVVVHADGLRAVRSEGVDGPAMDWRDWD